MFYLQRSQGAPETSGNPLESPRNNVRIFLRNNPKSDLNEAPLAADNILSPKVITSPIGRRVDGVVEPMLAKRVLVENYYTVTDSARNVEPTYVRTNMPATDTVN
ncbi:unnamed protein product [Dibothriocephalus latus]|uniref:Uncharacterized protein n=1 Tax=Dibothriocephalus latus TaxID=60516 RepID=A0A3P7LCK0_DIBLA|nr:unnamed protein product [Dibothriocephalus latus]